MKPVGSLNDSQAHDAPPPPIKSSRLRVTVLATAGAIVAIVLIVVAFNIDRNPPHQQRQNPSVTELIPPDTLDPKAGGGDFNRITTNLSDLGAENTWIQTTRDGKLAQQYRFASHEPSPEGLPPGWSKVNQPEIQLYLSDDRVLTMQSQTALLRATSRNLESGTMSGNVVIRLYELDANQSLSADDQPVMEAKTNEASFDNVQGEIRCDGAIDIQTPTAHLPGQALRVHINEVANRIEWLRMEHVDTIRLSALEETARESADPQANSGRSRGDGFRADRARSGKAPRAAPSPEKATFYRLTLDEKIHIQQRGRRMEWTADGDSLNITFSMRAAALNQTASIGIHQSVGCMTGLCGVMIALSIASIEEDSKTSLFIPSDDDIFVSCAKGMSMVPLGDADWTPPASDETHMELIGAPAHLRSASESIEIRCQSLGYLAKQQRIVVKGNSATPARIDSPEAEGEFAEFWLNRVKNEGGFLGPGWLILREKSDPEPVQPHEMDLRIEWLERVDLTFFDTKSNDRGTIGELQRAAFAGKVNVLSDELTMDADEMTVTLPPPALEAGQPRTLESIVANGRVHAVSLADEGSLACEHLDVRFLRTETGQTIPTNLSATGEVMARDRDEQIIWCNQLDIDFEPVNGAAVTGATSEASTRMRAVMKTMTADGNVQARLQDGVRAFGDQLHATGEESVVLTGNQVMVLREQGAIHGGRRLELTKADMSAHWTGAGQFSYFANAIAPDEPVRIARPVLDAIDPAVNPLHTRANWTESMNYDGQFNDGAGSLKLSGNVQAESRPNALEHNTLKSQTLTLQFADVAGGNTQTQPPTAQRRGFTELGQGKRDLKLFIAEGNAEVESHSWLLADHSDVSRVFFISGPYIEYDDQTFEAKVNGEGSLLVRDERIDADQPQPSNSQSFDAKGATQFRWTDHLHMTRLDGPLYQIQMVGGVWAIHQAMDKTSSSMRADQLIAIVERAAAAGAAGQARDAAFDLGGAMELRKITGNGTIVMRTANRDITADSIEYDYATGVASLLAQQGNTVYVKTAGNPHVTRAQAMSWNLREDKITVSNLRGTAPR